MGELDLIITNNPLLSRKKTNVGIIRTWLLLDSTGHTQMVEAGKQSIMRRTGIGRRDLRVLDPFLSCPSTILGRERAIVVNLEHIRAIITSNEVLLLNSKDPFVVPLAQELENKILGYYQATKQKEESDEDNLNSINKGSSKEPQQKQQQHLVVLTSEEQLESSSEEKGSEQEIKHAFKNQLEGSSKDLPFEFVALEACLEAACSTLDHEAETLDQEGDSALEKLISRVNTSNLQCVRQMKSRLVAVIGRAQQIKDRLERLLNDDNHMAEMYLTKKMSQRHLQDSSTSSTSEESDELDYEDIDMDDRFIPPEISVESYKEVDIEDNDNDKAKKILLGAPNAVGTDSHRTNSSLKIKESSVGELEMLLEAYLLKIEGTLNKLSTLREYVDDTEDYIDIMLDGKQNDLLELGIKVATVNVGLAFFVLIAAILGMNIKVPFYFESPEQGNPVFILYWCSNVVGLLVFFALAFGFYKYKGYI